MQELADSGSVSRNIGLQFTALRSDRLVHPDQELSFLNLSDRELTQ
jgi:hypothetical protein